MRSTLAGRRVQAPVAPTPTRLLDAAERLFAAQGYAGTSVRDITREASCNIAGINYHFGGKDKLYREVFARRLQELRDQRLVALRRGLQAGGQAPRLEAVIEVFARAFVEPLASQGEGRMLVELMVREMAEPHLPPAMFRSAYVDPLEREVAAALCSSEPRLSPEAARYSVRSLVAQLLHEVHAMRRQTPAPSPDEWRRTLEDTLRHIVRFSAAGVRACAAGAERP